MRVTACIAGVALSMAVQAAGAETLYITDKLFVSLRAAPEKDAAPSKTLASGTALEVLERNELGIRVRESGGGEGWVDARYLVAEPPARLQLARVQAQLKEKEAALARVTEELTALKAAPPPAAAPVPPPLPVAPEQTDSATPWWPWLAVSFAMLGIGFFAGMWWLRETYRRRMGGMYLRI